jgi:Baseplate J-like protein
MTCIIPRPDPQQLFNHLRDMFSSTVLGGGRVYPESNEWYVISNDYAAAEEFYAVADQMWRERNPETACCENLYIMAAQNGVFPRPATHAEGYAKLTGQPHAPVPMYFEIQTTHGTFVSTGSVPLELSQEGEVIVRIRALVPGADMNAAGTVTEGVLTTPAPGINAEVLICGGMFCGGNEVEDCEAFRKRYIDRLAYHPRATMAWIKQKFLEFPCATRVCIREGACCRCNPDCECNQDCGCKNCGNNMNFYVLFDTAFECGIPPQNVVDDITKWMFGEHQGYGEGEVEIGVCGQVFRPKPLKVNVLIDIEGCPSTGQKQLIENNVRALFQTICPSMPLYAKQIDLLVAMVIGPEINAAARFTVVGYENQNPPYPRELVFLDHCGLIPECDVLPCINDVIFTTPERRPPC